MSTLFSLVLKKIIIETPSYSPVYTPIFGCFPKILQIYCPHCIAQKRNIPQFLDDLIAHLDFCTCYNPNCKTPFICKQNTHKHKLHTFDLEKLAKKILHKLQKRESSYYKNRHLHCDKFPLQSIIWDATQTRNKNWKLHMTIDTIPIEEYYTHLVTKNMHNLSHIGSIEEEIKKLYINISTLYEKEPKKYEHIYFTYCNYPKTFIQIMINANLAHIEELQHQQDQKIFPIFTLIPYPKTS